MIVTDLATGFGNLRWAYLHDEPEAPKVGFCSGSFDAFHCGHSEFLRKCKEQCDVLVVMAPTDRQIAYLKPGRPVTREQDRLLLIDAIRWVDYCFLDPWARNDLTGIEEAFKLLRPAKYFCGPDSHEMEWRQRTCAKHGVELVIVPRHEGVTTTSILEKCNANKLHSGQVR